MHFRAFDFVAGCPQTNRWKLNLQTEIGHGSSSCFDPGRGWQSLSHRDPMDCKSSSGNQPPPATGLPGTIVAEGSRKMQIVIFSKDTFHLHGERGWPKHTCQHMSTHVNNVKTCQHMSTHVNTCQHMSTHVNNVNTCQHMSTHVNTCQHMSTHVNTCQHMSTHVNTLTCQYSKCNLLGLDQGACVGFVGKV